VSSHFQTETAAMAHMCTLGHRLWVRCAAVSGSMPFCRRPGTPPPQHLRGNMSGMGRVTRRHALAAGLDTPAPRDFPCGVHGFFPESVMITVSSFNAFQFSQSPRDAPAQVHRRAGGERETRENLPSDHRDGYRADKNRLKRSARSTTVTVSIKLSARTRRPLA